MGSAGRREAIVVIASLTALGGIRSTGEAQDTGAAPQRVSIRVESGVRRGPMKPIWAWFGYDEPNYTYAPNGKKLLSAASVRGLRDERPAGIYLLHSQNGGESFEGPALRTNMEGGGIAGAANLIVLSDGTVGTLFANTKRGRDYKNDVAIIETRVFGLAGPARP